MTYRSAHAEITAAILRALRSAVVADAVGVDPTAWASTTSPRVMVGNKDGYVAGLHRGRLPALEVFCLSEGWERQSDSGGTLLSVWTIRIHHNGPSQEAADAACRLGMGAALTMIRSDEISGLDIGALESVEALASTPLGFMLATSVTFAHSFGVDTFTVQKTP